MTRVVKTGELFATFNYDGKDCADMGIYNVTSGSVYTMNIEPTFTDHKLEVPAYDGKYYYGTQITGQQFQFTCFCHDLLSTEYDRMRAWLNPRNIGRLILSDQPYKYYLVKPVSVSTLGAYPLTTIQTPDYSLMGDYAQGDVVYTGNFTVTFETVGSAYGYGLCYYRDDLIYDAKKKYGRDYYYNSGLLYKDMCPDASWDIPANGKDIPMPLYNPGSAFGQPKYLIDNDEKFPDNSYIQINNTDCRTSTVIDIGGTTGPLVIDIQSQSITDSMENVYFGRFKGTAMRLNPADLTIEIPETWVKNIENTDLIEYDSFYIENNIVEMNPNILKVTEDLIGRYFCVNGNGGSEIISVDIDNNTLTLDNKKYTRDIPKADVDPSTGVLNRPAGCEFNYIDIHEDATRIPSAPKEGDVYQLDGVWYLYQLKKDGSGEWKETNLFSNDEDFKNIFGTYIPIYKMFGATIVILDKVTITTGTNINYKDGTQTKRGTSVGNLKISAELLPRYL